MRHPVATLALIGLFATVQTADAACSVKGSATAMLVFQATITDGSSKVNTTLGGPATFEGDTILLTRLARPRIGSITPEGPVVERALAHDRPVRMKDGSAQVNGSPRGSYHFQWDTKACTVREASLGVVHLAWYLDERQAQKNRPW